MLPRNAEFYSAVSPVFNRHRAPKTFGAPFRTSVPSATPHFGLLRPVGAFRNERTPSASPVAQNFILPYRRFSTGSAHPKHSAPLPAPAPAPNPVSWTACASAPLFRNKRIPNRSPIPNHHPKKKIVHRCPLSPRERVRVRGRVLRLSELFRKQEITNHNRMPNQYSNTTITPRSSFSLEGPRSAKRSPNLGHPYCGGPGRPLGKDEGVRLLFKCPNSNGSPPPVAQIFNLPYRRFSTGTAHPKHSTLLPAPASLPQPRVLECVRFSAAFPEQTNHKLQPNTQPPPEKKPSPIAVPSPSREKVRMRGSLSGPLSNLKSQISDRFPLLTPSHYCHIVL